MLAAAYWRYTTPDTALHSSEPVGLSDSTDLSHCWWKGKKPVSLCFVRAVFGRNNLVAFHCAYKNVKPDF